MSLSTVELVIFVHKISLFLCCLLATSGVVVVDGFVSTPSYRPQGLNPLLYEPGVDPILQLDADTFVDTVLNARKDRAILVEFYKDWCGYCRRFVPFFKQLAESVKDWPFIQLAVINCADSYNTRICKANNIPTVPKLKYFRRKATTFAEGEVIQHVHSAMDMRQKLHEKILDEFTGDETAIAHIVSTAGDTSCPKSLCLHLNSLGTNARDDAWQDVSEHTEYQAFVIEKEPRQVAQLTLDLLQYKPRVEVRPVHVSNTADVRSTLQPGRPSVQLPYLIFVHRATSNPLLVETLSNTTVSKILSIIDPMVHKWNETEMHAAHMRPKHPVLDCSLTPELCRAMFFVSEVDMLKAVRTALLDEVISSGGDWLDADKFKALKHFIELLIKRFPQFTKRDSTEVVAIRSNGGAKHEEERLRNAQKEHYYSQHPKATAFGAVVLVRQLPLNPPAGEGGGGPKPLPNSQRAVKVFRRLNDVLSKATTESGRGITMDEWKAAVEEAEEAEGRPFLMEEDWEHCKGTTTIYRGFTCGLWTTFHTMAVNSFLAGDDVPLRPLRSIQEWVGSFFSCSGCRKHFLEMTTKTFPLDAEQVSRPIDTVLYLWKAHNKVNKRLRGDEATEDPQFPKDQFPPAFLCPDCRLKEAAAATAVASATTNADGLQQLFDETRTVEFLTQFAQDIKPFEPQQSKQQTRGNNNKL